MLQKLQKRAASPLSQWAPASGAVAEIATDLAQDLFRRNVRLHCFPRLDTVERFHQARNRPRIRSDVYTDSGELDAQILDGHLPHL